MEKIKNTIKNDLISKILCLLIISFAGVLLYVGLQVYTDSMYKYYSRVYQKGQIANEDLLVNSSIDVYDAEATNQLKEKNARAVLPVFVYSMEETLNSIEKYDIVKKALETKDYSKVTSLCGSDVSTFFRVNNYEKVLSVAYEVMNKVLDKGLFKAEELSEMKKDRYNSITVIHESVETTILLNGDLYSDGNIYKVVDEMISKYADDGLSLTEATIAQKLVISLLDTNIQYDEKLTTSRKNAAIENTKPVYISFEKGQILMEKDRVVTDEQLSRIKLIGSSSTVTVTDIIAECLFIVISLTVAMILFSFFLNEEKYHRIQYLWITTIGLVLTCIVSFFTVRQAVYHGVSFTESYIPICFVPVLITMISGKRTMGYVTSLFVGLLVSATPSSSYLTIIYCTLYGLIGCALVRFFNKRTDMVVQWVSTLCCTTVLIILFENIGSYPRQELLYDLIGNAVNISITMVVIAILLPLLERAFNLSTVFRLNELAYGNNPLLAKLADVAPGTYSHSKMVSELAEAASKEIGANDLLAKVGGLYHDIGKIEHPEYFVENQAGENRHEELNPGLSVAIIKSHVKVGADKGRESGLPVELIDIIANHHGNDIIAYFYNEAKKQADEDDVVVSSDYCYSSASIPETKECAVVMLADSVEAAARTVSEPTAIKFAKLINSIVFGKIERGQLNNCDLSMKEIEQIKESFLKTLSAQYHSRIEYPDEEDEK